MSVQRVIRNSGKRFEVRWRSRGKQKSRTFIRKGDADKFWNKVQRLQQTKDLDQIDAGRQLLADFVVEYWDNYAVQHLSPATRKANRSALNANILPALGDFELREIKPVVVMRLIADLQKGGKGNATIRRSVLVLQGIIQQAVESEYLSSNPVRSVRKPTVTRQRQVTPWSPELIEKIRHHLNEAGKIRDATLISVLAYGGLRPSEALGLTWGAIGKHMHVYQQSSFGQLEPTKTRKKRHVRITPALREDLNAWKRVIKPQRDTDLIFPDTFGNVVSESGKRNWRKRVWKDVAPKVGLEDSRPYDARHTFVSLLIHEGRNVVEVARQAGHSTSVCLDVYAHEFEEQDLDQLEKMEDAIQKARSSVRDLFGGGRGSNGRN